MSDFQAVPRGAFDLAFRMKGASLATRNAYLVVVALADDWGRLEGDPEDLARRLGCRVEEAEEVLSELSRRRLVRIYEATDTIGDPIRVAEVTLYAELQGQLRKVTDPSKRRPSGFPDRPPGMPDATRTHSHAPAQARMMRAHDARVHDAHDARMTGAGARASRAHDAREQREQRRAEESRALAPPGPAALALPEAQCGGESYAPPLEAGRDSPTQPTPPTPPPPAEPAPPAAPPTPPRRHAAYARLEEALGSLRPRDPDFGRKIVAAFDPPLDAQLPPDEALAMALAVEDIDTEVVSGVGPCVRWVKAWMGSGMVPGPSEDSETGE